MDRRRERLRTGVRKGNRRALDALIHDFARRGPRRRRARIRTLTRAAERGDAEAQAELAWWCFDAGEVELAYVWWMWSRGKEWRHEGSYLALLRHAAERGIPSAMAKLGDAYVDGLYDVRKNLRRGVEWLRRAAEAGDPGACLSIEALQDEGKLRGLIARRELVRWLRLAAAHGDAWAQHSLGMKLYLGDGVRRDLAAAAPWLRRAAAQGQSDAWLTLGYMYGDGRGVRRNWQRARTCYQRAALLGEGDAYWWLVRHYEGRDGARRNPRLVAAWVRRAEAAARRGSVEACSFLGDYLSNEQSTLHDRRRALHWLRLGAAQDDDMSLLLLGWHLHGGIGVERDRARAVRLYRRAIELGNARAAYQLALCYQDGEGVHRDPRAARRWMEHAAAGGEVLARRALAKTREHSRASKTR